MGRYKVTITEMVTVELYVEGDNPDEARNMAYSRWVARRDGLPSCTYQLQDCQAEAVIDYMEEKEYAVLPAKLVLGPESAESGDYYVTQASDIDESAAQAGVDNRSEAERDADELYPDQA